MCELELALAPAVLHRHRRVIEALFDTDADPSVFGTCGGGPLAFDVRATAVGLAALATGTVTTRCTQLAVRVLGVEFTFELRRAVGVTDGPVGPVKTASLVIASPSKLANDAVRVSAKPSVVELATRIASTSCPSAPNDAVTRLVESVLRGLSSHDNGTSAAAPPVTLVVGGSGSGKTRLACALARGVAFAMRTGSAYVATRVIDLPRVFAACERGIADATPTALWLALRTALCEAVHGVPFLCPSQRKRRSLETPVATSAMPPATVPALIVLDGAEVLDGSLMQLRAAALGLASWLRSLCGDDDAGARGSPVAVVLMCCSGDDGTCALAPILRTPALVNADMHLPALPHAAAMRRLATQLLEAGELPAGTSGVESACARVQRLLDEAGRTSARLTTTADVVKALRCGEDEVKNVAPPSSTADAQPRALSAALVGIDDAREALAEAVVRPLALARAAPLHALGLRVPKGALVTGPTGCGKTALLAALARELEAQGACRTMLVSAHALIQKEVGESEKNVARIFAEARASSPCVLLIDGLDAIAAPRGRTEAETDKASDRVLSTLLVEMDGMTSTSSTTTSSSSTEKTASSTGLPPVVVVVATAPSPDMLDPAVRRSGRLDVHVTLPAPTAATAAELLLGRLPLPMPTSEVSVAACRDLAAARVGAKAWSSFAEVVGYCREISVDAIRTAAVADDDAGIAAVRDAVARRVAEDAAAAAATKERSGTT